MTYSPKGMIGPVCRWKLSDGVTLPEFEAHTPNQRIAFSANGRFQVVFTQESDEEHRLQVWRTETADPILVRNRLIPNENVGEPPTELAISDNGAVIAWSRHTSLVLFNFNNGRRTTWPEEWKNRLLTLSHDGRLLAAVEDYWKDGKVRIWNVANEAPVLRPKATLAAKGPVYGVQFSPDGAYLATAVWNSPPPGM